MHDAPNPYQTPAAVEIAVGESESNRRPSISNRTIAIAFRFFGGLLGVAGITFLAHSFAPSAPVRLVFGWSMFGVVTLTLGTAMIAVSLFLSRADATSD